MKKLKKLKKLSIIMALLLSRITAMGDNTNTYNAYLEDKVPLKKETATERFFYFFIPKKSDSFELKCFKVCNDIIIGAVIYSLTQVGKSAKDHKNEEYNLYSNTH